MDNIETKPALVIDLLTAFLSDILSPNVPPKVRLYILSLTLSNGDVVSLDTLRLIYE